jgi:hypothetical protein
VQYGSNNEGMVEIVPVAIILKHWIVCLVMFHSSFEISNSRATMVSRYSQGVLDCQMGVDGDSDKWTGGHIRYVLKSSLVKETISQGDGGPPFVFQR